MFLNLFSLPRRTERRRARLALEALEQRTLLSAGLLDLNLAGTASGNDGALESRDAGQLGSGARQRQTPDGRFVVFESPSSDLVAPGIDVNGFHPDVFLRDRQAGITQAVSLRDGINVTGNDNSYSPVISPNGNDVVFESIATDLVPHSPAGPNLFLRDLQAKRTLLLGPGVVRTEGGNDAVFSGNSQFVTYTSSGQVYVRDLSAGTTTLVSINKDGTGPGLGTSQEPAISGDGRYIAFTSIASNLVPNFTNAFSTQNLFLRDMQTGTTTVLTHNGNIGGNGDSLNPHLSDNGRTLVFESTAYNLGLNDTNTNLNDILAYDLPSGRLSMVSANATGTGSGDSSSFEPVVSADGRYVAFESLAHNLTTNTGNGTNKNVFIRDLQTGTTTLVSINSAHTRSGNNESGLPSISADGRMIAFESRSSDLVSGFIKHNGSFDYDIYLYDQQTGNVSLLSSDYHNPAGSGNGDSMYPVISADGRYVIFHGTASNLDPRDTGPMTDVFVSPPDFSVAPGPATHFSIVASVSTVTAGTPFSITVTALDDQGNAVPYYAGTVHFLATLGATLPDDYTFTGSDQGTHVFDGVVLTQAGNQTVTATDTVSAITANTTLAVTPAPATQFSLSAPAETTSGTPFDITVTALDPFGNVDVNYAGTVHFTSTDDDPSVVVPDDYTFTSDDSGTHTFSSGVTLISAGDQTLTVTDLAAAISGSAIVTVDSPPAPPGGGSAQGPKGGRFADPIEVLASPTGQLPLQPAYLAPVTRAPMHRTRDLDGGSVDWLFASSTWPGQDSAYPNVLGEPWPGIAMGH